MEHIATTREDDMHAHLARAAHAVIQAAYETSSRMNSKGNEALFSRDIKRAKRARLERARLETHIGMTKDALTMRDPLVLSLCISELLQAVEHANTVHDFMNRELNRQY